MQAATNPSPLAVLPAAADRVVLLLLLLGFAALYAPSYIDLARRVWPTDEQGHGPIILALGLWLLYGQRHALAALPVQPDKVSGMVLLVLGVLMYALGRTQGMLVLEVLSSTSWWWGWCCISWAGAPFS